MSTPRAESDAPERMDEALVLDGNAVAGLLQELFGAEMTTALGMCDACGTNQAVGMLRAYTRGPGVVLRCHACTEIMVRIALTPRGTFFDVRGTRVLHMSTK